MMKDFFASLVSSYKRKYPLIVSYNKYMEGLKNTILQDREVDMFRTFLLENQKKMEFTQPEFKTSKEHLSINMNIFTSAEDFWKSLYDVETILFPQGKPILEEQTASQPPLSSSEVALNILEKTPMFADVVQQVKSSNMSNITDVSDFLAKPEFNIMVKNIKGGLNSGKYSLQDLTSTLGTIINTVQKDLDPKEKETLATVTETITAVERGESLDINKLLLEMMSLKLKQ